MSAPRSEYKARQAKYPPPPTDPAAEPGLVPEDYNRSFEGLKDVLTELSVHALSTGEPEPEVPDFSKTMDFDAFASLGGPPFMADIEGPAVAGQGEAMMPEGSVDLAKTLVGECLSIEQQMERQLGVGGAAEIDGAGRIRVRTGGSNTRFGHGRSIIEALYDLHHPGQLPGTSDST